MEDYFYVEEDKLLVNILIFIAYHPNTPLLDWKLSGVNK